MTHNFFDQLWELDKENSYARFTITPIRRGDRVVYQWEDELWIKPYPNPFSYGGYWGQGVAKTSEEVERLLSFFKEDVAEWRERGLEKVEIIRHPEMTEAESRNQKIRDRMRQEEKPISTQLSLIV